jgi:predicted metalloprotease with PDZ domain
MIYAFLLPILLAASSGQQSTADATLMVDASEAPMHIIHTVEILPVAPGALTLSYAKWIPGEHMPSGPIENLVNLHILAGNAELTWRRDLVDLYKFQVQVPTGTTALTIKLDYVTPVSSGSYGASPSTTSNLGVINWYENAIWPEGVVPDVIRVTPTLKMPAGWKNGGSLDIASASGDTVQYATTSVAQLNDHPVVIGRHYRKIDLFAQGSDVGEHAIDIIADNDWALDVPQSRIDNYKRLVREERAVFGGVGHYRKYHWLLTLSDILGNFGVEHHECADDRAPANTLVDDDMSKQNAVLLPHEFFHSWNGKTLRPSGLINGGYENPMRDDGLWVYEGMTNYYGEVLATRCGLLSPGEYQELLAAEYAQVSVPGRTWRPLQDTADSAPFLYKSPTDWSGLRRSVDFYPEGSLIWLEADAKIRQMSHGAKSLDDFCAAFEGGIGGKTYVKPYEISEVYDALNKVAPYDWRSFFEAKLNSKSEFAPDGGFTAAGYRMVYNDQPNRFLSPGGHFEAGVSLGLRTSSDGTVQDSWPGYPGYKAGVAVGSKIIAVNGRQFSDQEFKRAVAEAEHGTTPIQLIVKSGVEYKTVQIDYHKGLHFPHLERIAGTPDLLLPILSAKTKG